MSDNPYAPPSFGKPVRMPASIVEDELADRGTRFVASLLDAFLVMAVLIPVYLFTGFTERAMKQEVEFLEDLAMLLSGIVIFLAINGYLLVARGQSVGKYFLKIQIVDQKMPELLPFERVCVYRYMWHTLISIILMMIPMRAGADGVIVSLLSWADALFIFGAARLCIHDHIAYSKVVRFQPDRPRLG